MDGKKILASAKAKRIESPFAVELNHCLQQLDSAKADLYLEFSFPLAEASGKYLKLGQVRPSEDLS